jgi:hypothetical protein
VAKHGQHRTAVQKLKQVYWLYANVDDDSDDASRRIVECQRHD